MPTRRAFIRGTGALLGAGVLSGVAAADHYDAQPEHVSLTYDEATLKQYRPELVFPAESREKFIGLYGWLATSPEYDTDVCVFWSSYTHQEGWLGNRDSHYGDHEPCYVFVDSQTGDVREVVASIYHWIAGKAPASEVTLRDETHPWLRVIAPWHQYTAADRSGTYPEVKDLTGEFQSWLDNGLEDALEPGAVVNPWRMQTRGDWWRRKYGVSTNALLVKATKAAGIGQAGSLSK